MPNWQTSPEAKTSDDWEEVINEYTHQGLATFAYAPDKKILLLIHRQLQGC